MFPINGLNVSLRPIRLLESNVCTIYITILQAACSFCFPVFNLLLSLLLLLLLLILLLLLLLLLLFSD